MFKQCRWRKQMSERNNPEEIAVPGMIPKNHKIEHERLVDASTPYGEWAQSLSPNQAQGLREQARPLLRDNAKLFERATRNPIRAAAALAALESDNPPALIALFDVIKKD